MDWVPFQEGEYLVEEAFLLTADYSAVPVERGVIEVYEDARGRHLRGSGKTRAYFMVELFQEHDEIDLILDLGDEFKYRLPNPRLSAGKIFSPDVAVFIQFSPTRPWEQIPEKEFAALKDRMAVLTRK